MCARPSLMSVAVGGSTKIWVDGWWPKTPPHLLQQTTHFGECIGKTPRAKCAREIFNSVPNPPPWEAFFHCKFLHIMSRLTRGVWFWVWVGGTPFLPRQVEVCCAPFFFFLAGPPASFFFTGQVGSTLEEHWIFPRIPGGTGRFHAGCAQTFCVCVCVCVCVHVQG